MTGRLTRHIDSLDLPQDVRLPKLASAFDLAQVVEAIHARTDAPSRRLSGRVSYVRYKPGTNCIVALAFDAEDGAAPAAGYVKAYTDSDYVLARSKLTQRKWAKLGPYPPYVSLDASQAILYLSPNDTELSGLRAIANSKLLQRALYAYEDQFPEDHWRISDTRLTVELIRYKPEKRAVIRIDTRAVNRENGDRRPLTVYGRIYLPGQAKAHFELLRALEHEAFGHEPRVPHALGHLDREDLVLVARLEGDPVSCEAILTGELRDHVARAGRALRALHRLNPQPLSVRNREVALADCAATVQSICSVAPELSPRASELRARLRGLSNRVQPYGIGFVHGDFHPGQLLASGAGIGVLDFDRAHTSEQALDLGNFRAHLLASASGTAASRESMAQAFLEGYGATGNAQASNATLDFWTAVGLLSLTVQPFRSLESGWRGRMAELLARCEAVVVA